MPSSQRSARLAVVGCRAWGLIVGLAVCVGLLSGCAYRFGNATLYPPEIRTVHVPMFEATSIRRNLGERLTEAVVREIEAKTPLKVVASAGADSTLTGRIVTDFKGTTLTAPTAEPRNIQLTYGVQIVWTDRRGNRLQTTTIPLPTSIVNVDQSTYLIPEAGQSMATSQQRAIDKLATQIVSLMESPW